MTEIRVPTLGESVTEATIGTDDSCIFCAVMLALPALGEDAYAVSIRDHIEATTLGYLSIPGVVRAVGRPEGEFCLACFNGKYPIELPETNGALGKYSLTVGGSQD